MTTAPVMPATLDANAWAGGPRGIEGPIGPGALDWAADRALPQVERWFAPGPPADARNWRDERVGWGLILLDDARLSEAERVSGADAPPPIRQLLEARGQPPVLRYDPRTPTTLRRYYVDRESDPLDIAGTGFGTAPGRIPRYLLIYGPPTTIPWDLQFNLNTRFAVGRLSLEGRPLEHYVRELISGWSDGPASPLRPVVWATELNRDDVSAKMRSKIAIPVHQSYVGDPDIGGEALLFDRANGGATAATLRSALQERAPGMVVTTSHGKAGKEGAAVTTLDDLGWLVGEDQSLASPAELLAAWQPNGVIWYAHACCSAGSNTTSVYEGLFKEGSPNHALIGDIAALGDSIAPLPQALLGHERPARAFVGHVEPTYGWTIQNPFTNLTLASGIRSALWDCLFQVDPVPIGLAFSSFYASIGQYASLAFTLLRRIKRGEATPDQLLAVQLAARDRMSTVILGDPVVTLRLPAASGGSSAHRPGPPANCPGI